MTSALPPTGQPTTDQPTIDQPTGETHGSADRQQLRRSSTDRMLGGVSGGLAEYSGVDVVLWRVGFVVLTLMGGSGILLYLLLWLVIPSAPLGTDTEPSPVERWVGRLHTALIGALGSRDRRS